MRDNGNTIANSIKWEGGGDLLTNCPTVSFSRNSRSIVSRE
jgi:hypothetical protein